MSEYAYITIEKLSLYSFRNFLDDAVVGLFYSPDDLCIIPDCKNDPEDEDSENYTRCRYITTVKRAKERLDARGFGLNQFEELFVNKAVDAIDYSSFLDHLHVQFDNREQTARKRIKKYVTFQKWKNAIKKIVEYEITNGDIKCYIKDDISINTECEKIIYYALKNDYSKSIYAINATVIHPAYVFRLILEYCEPDEELVLDFSCLGNWSEESISEGITAAENVEKTIVLVEGTTDKAILEFAITKLYPHLADLFYFMDFDDDSGVKREGGTSYLVKNMKTFYFSKIQSSFIAIFDNDAEGYKSQCELLFAIKKWPDNFRILRYPDIKQYKKYPTVASNGNLIDDDINKKACSIELYLPDRIIKNKNNYSPIEWECRKIFNNANGNKEAIYQGVVSNKNEIQDRFNQLKKQIENGAEEFIPEEWERMRQLLDTIVFAFS